VEVMSVIFSQLGNTAYGGVNGGCLVQWVGSAHPDPSSCLGNALDHAQLAQ